MKVLCVCPIGIGNYLLTYPACRMLKKRRPELSLHLLGLRTNIRDWAAADALWDGVHVFDPTRLDGGLSEALRIVGSLRREKFDVCLGFFPANKWQYNLLAFLAGVGQRYAFRYRLKSLSSLSFLSTSRVPVDSRLHDLEQNCALAGAFLGEDLSHEQAVFPELFAGTESGWAEEYVRTRTKGGVLLGIHPGSSADHGMEAKRWAPERFGGLVDRICSFTGGEALIFGGPEESGLKRRVAETARAPAICVDAPSLRHTAALLSKCALTVCNDSGLMHISACLGVPTVGIFGPTDPRRNGPRGARTLAVRKDMPGFPLWTADNVGRRDTPPGIDPHASLEALTVEDAWGQIRPALEGWGVGRS